MYSYLVKLTPLEPYFFGGNINFFWKSQKNNKDKDRGSRYLIKSRDLPQQTTLLGMIRKEILMSEEGAMIKVNDEEVPFKYKYNIRKYGESEIEYIGKLIGKSSFNMKKPPSEYGIIKNISSVFIMDKRDNIYIKTPYDYNKNGYKPFVYKDGILDGYDPKAGITDCFMNVDTFNLCTEKIFRDFKKVGIDKDDKGSTKEDSYFKAIFKVMEKEFSFAFVLNTKEELRLKNKIVYMGAKKSAFKMELKKVENNYFKIPKEDNKIILLSDTYIDENIYDKCVYAITNTIDFNNLQTTYGKNHKMKKTLVKFTLLKSGSVLYPKTNQDRKYILDKINKENIQKIGYNHIWQVGGLRDVK